MFQWVGYVAVTMVALCGSIPIGDSSALVEHKEHRLECNGIGLQSAVRLGP